MKNMRRLSLIIALALCISVGGVYATWTYITDAATGTADGTSSMTTVGMATVVTDSSSAAKGTISVENTYGTTLEIDDKADYTSSTSSEDKYVIALAWAADGQYLVKFTPSAYADANLTSIIVNYTIAITFQGYNGTANTYNSEKIFLLNGQSDNLTYTGTLNNVNSTGMEIDLETLITVNEEIKLETEDAYNAFKEALGTVTITITLEEATTT